MSNDNINRLIEFIIQQQAIFTVDMGELKEAQRQLTADIKSLTHQISGVTGGLHSHNGASLTEHVSALTEAVSTTQIEIRDAINKLIVANEATRNLTETVANLAVNDTRATIIESKS